MTKTGHNDMEKRKRYMKKRYETKLLLNGTNIPVTVPSHIVHDTKTTKGTPFQWVDNDKGELMLEQFQGTRKEAEARAKEHKDVVFLQQMRKNAWRLSPQYKLNMPKWVYQDREIDPDDITKIKWHKTPDNEIGGIVVIYRQIA